MSKTYEVKFWLTEASENLSLATVEAGSADEAVKLVESFGDGITEGIVCSVRETV